MKLFTILLTGTILMFFISCSENLETDKAKVSYGIGKNMGMSIKRQGIEVDYKILALGIKDALEGKEGRIPDAEIMAAIQRYRSGMQNSSEPVNTKNLEEGKAFLEENKKKKGVMVTDSGLQYKIIKKGYGKKATINDTVKVHYKGTLIDGKEFDSSYKRKKPAEFPLRGVIKGWQEGLQLMNTGAKFQFVVPSNLGYGSRGTGNIPGDSVLIFDVELLEIKK